MKFTYLKLIEAILQEELFIFQENGTYGGIGTYGGVFDTQTFSLAGVDGIYITIDSTEKEPHQMDITIENFLK